MGFYPALAQIGGPLMGGHLASVEVTRWPLTWHSIVAFLDGCLGHSQPGKAWHTQGSASVGSWA